MGYVNIELNEIVKVFKSYIRTLYNTYVVYLDNSEMVLVIGKDAVYIANRDDNEKEPGAIIKLKYDRTPMLFRISPFKYAVGFRGEMGDLYIWQKHNWSRRKVSGTRKEWGAHVTFQNRKHDVWTLLSREGEVIDTYRAKELYERIALLYKVTE